MSFVQYPKYGPNYVQSGSTTASTTSGTFTALITLGSLTVTGAFPVEIKGFTGKIQVTGTASTLSGDFAIFRDGSEIARHPIGCDDLSGASNNLFIPASSVIAIDFPAAGSYVYSLRARIVSADSVSVDSAKLIAMEMSVL